MAKDITVFLRHIIDSVEIIKFYLDNKSIDNFRNSLQLQDSVIRRLEIIGEAVKNIPEDFKSTYPDLPWREIAGLRDVLIHQYFGVDIELTWQIASYDVPALKKEIEKVLENLE